MEILWPAARQYRHNNSDEFVGAYDRDETEKIVSLILNALWAAEAFIDSHAADPDITAEMAEKYAAYNAAIARLPKAG